MPNPPRTDEQYLELGEDENLSTEQLDNQVQRAQEQLLALKRAQDQLERQKRDLEELSRRQEQLHQGKTEMVERFTRAVVVLERETYEAQKRVEQLQAIHASFSQHLDVLEGINPKTWEGAEINKELNRALSAVDDARAEFNRSLPKISIETNSDEADSIAAASGYQLEYGAEPPKDFLYWLKAGTAFTLPIIVILVIMLFMLLGAMR
jgi:hypothetical protein